MTDVSMFGSFRLRSVLNNMYVGVYGDVKSPDKRLYADTTNSANAAVFTYLTPNKANVGQ
jgi:hypothetical protein